MARSDRMITASQVRRRRGHRGFNLTVGTTKRLFLLTTALGVCLELSACAPLAGVVTDAWPTWAGGMPKDVPPRPGAPGYEEFIAHQHPAGRGPAKCGAEYCGGSRDDRCGCADGHRPWHDRCRRACYHRPRPDRRRSAACRQLSAATAAGAVASRLRPTRRPQRDAGWIVLGRVAP